MSQHHGGHMLADKPNSDTTSTANANVATANQTSEVFTFRKPPGLSPLPDPPYFIWEALGPKKLVIDYITHTPMVKRADSFVPPSISILINGDEVTVWGWQLLVEVSNDHPAFAASDRTIASSTRPQFTPCPGKLPRWRWIKESLGEYLIEFEKILVKLETKKRHVVIWDASLVVIHINQGRPREFRLKPIPKPILPPSSDTLTDYSLLGIA